MGDLAVQLAVAVVNVLQQLLQMEEVLPKILTMYVTATLPKYGNGRSVKHAQRSHLPVCLSPTTTQTFLLFFSLKLFNLFVFLQLLLKLLEGWPTIAG